MIVSLLVHEDRLGGFKEFIKNVATSARFVGNPIMFNNNNWYITLNINVDDANKLSELLAKWMMEDNKPSESNDGLLKRLFKRLLNFLR